MQSEIKSALETLRKWIRGDRKLEPNEGPRASIQLGAPAPDFEATTTHGPIRLSTWNQGKWVILFSHPADFTPVCTTEFVELSRRADEFAKRNVALLGNSVDSIYAHLGWLRSIKETFGVEVPFPVIADLDMHVSKLYGMIHEAASDTSPVRALYFLDPDRRVRAVIHYPLNVGRHIDEVLRVVDGLQMVDEMGLAAPANWTPGQPAIVPPPKTVEEMEERLRTEGLEIRDWYFSTKTPKKAA